MELSNEQLASLRKDYMLKEFDESHLLHDPYAQFASWFKEALDAGVNEPNAMTLATVSADGQPHARIVLLKGFDREGASFFTNYQSKKGNEMAEGNKVALVFFWHELERQVRVEGTVEKLSTAQSDVYFSSRPRSSQIGTHASPQSRVIPNRSFIDERIQNTEAAFAGKPIPRPGHWGGYLVRPHHFEFWQGRESRLHDRFLFTQEGDGWKIERLAP